MNVNCPKSFLDAAQREKLREREARESGLMFSRDRLIEMTPVSTLYYIHVQWNLPTDQRRSPYFLEQSYITCATTHVYWVKGRHN